MKTEQILKKQQPVVYSILYNALKNNRLSHCYLFTGDKGTYKKETAYLLAESIICSEKDDVWACQQCIDCIRIEENNYYDLIYLDGSSSLIKIEEIENMQIQFQKTALEQAGFKFLIINGAENMTAKAANSLLKLIEEPEGDLTIILISEKPERLLPTIVSRAQIINFKPLSKENLKQQALELGFDSLNAHISSQLVQSQDELAAFNDDICYQKALSYFVEFANRLFTSYYDCVFYMQNNSFKVSDSDSAKKNSKDCFSLFLQIATIFAHDYLNNIRTEDESWDSLLEKAHSIDFNVAGFLKSISNSQDCLLYAANQALVIDQLLYQLKEVIK